MQSLLRVLIASDISFFHTYYKKMSKYAEELLTVCLLVFILPYHTTVAFYLFLSYEVRADLFNPNYW